MENYYIVSFSGGKDSTAMLLRLMELGEPINEVIFCDTYMEFPDLLKHIYQIKEVVEQKGIKFTTLRNEKSFEYYLLEHEPKKRRNPDLEGLRGYGWASATKRWCTGELKKRVVEAYTKELRKKYNLIQYIGIAADEQKRLERKEAYTNGKVYPLNDWGWTEEQCLHYCYSFGYDFGGLYELFDRVSCWCCPLKSLKELRTLYYYFPELWHRLEEMDSKSFNQFRIDYSVKELGIRFDFEEERLEQGLSIRNRDFFTQLKERIANAADKSEP